MIHFILVIATKVPQENESYNFYKPKSLTGIEFKSSKERLEISCCLSLMIPILLVFLLENGTNLTRGMPSFKTMIDSSFPSMRRSR